MNELQQLLSLPIDSAMENVRALTIWEPWTSLILGMLHDPPPFRRPPLKRVENRSYSTTWVSKPIALHAGTQWAPFAINFVENRFGKEESLYINPGPNHWSYHLGHIVGFAVIDRVVSKPDDLEPEQRPWFIGEYGWVLRDVVRIKPVKQRGYQRLWKLKNRQVLETCLINLNEAINPYPLRSTT